MSGFPPSLERLIRQLTALPGIGRKSATRIALRIVGSTAAECRELAEAVLDAKRRTIPCSICGSLTEDDPCAICRDARRDATLLCVVEKASDVLAVERTGRFGGRYHVLGGVLSPLDGVGPEDLGIERLVDRVRSEGVAEIILALNPTTEGEATSLYLARRVSPVGVRVTRLASGLPVGGDLDLADERTLGAALEERRDL